MKEMNDPKKQVEVFRKKLWKYNQPLLFVLLGFIVSAIGGLTAPLVGTFFMLTTFTMYESLAKSEPILENV